MSWKFEIARGDLLPRLRMRLVDDRGQPVNLSTATSIVFAMKHERTGRHVVGPVNVLAAASGEVEYAWAPGDTAIGGMYVAKVVVMFGEHQLTVPTCPERREALVEVCG